MKKIEMDNSCMTVQRNDGFGISAFFRQRKKDTIRSVPIHILNPSPFLSIFIFLFFFTQSAVADSNGGFEFNAVTAEKYAQGALIEGFVLPSEIKQVNAAIKTKPIILSGVNKEGKKLVLVLYRKNSGAFAVGLFVNKDGSLQIDSRTLTSDPVEKFIDQFNVEPFTWGSMGDDGQE